MTCQRTMQQPLSSPPNHHLSPRRSGFRTDAPSGRSARRLPMFSELRGLSCQHTTACLSSHPRRQQQRPWATASAPFTPTTRAGPRQGCPACLSCSCRPPWAASRPWRSRCLSVVSAPGRRLTPWVYPTCLQTAPGYSHTSTSPRSLGWCPRPCLARPTWAARLSCVVPRTVTPGEGQASPRCAAKRSSTQYPWVSPSNTKSFSFSRVLVLLHLVHRKRTIRILDRHNKRERCYTSDITTWRGLKLSSLHRTDSLLRSNLLFRMKLMTTIYLSI